MTDEEIVALLQHPIPYVQKQLTERDKSTPVTIDEMKEILSAEKAGKERVTLTGWLEYGIATKRLPDQFFLSYQDRVSCFKSALQKYVRRGLPEKAMSVAKSLYKLNRQQAVRRMKIIVVEDVFQAVEVLKFFRDDMSLNEFLALVKVVAESPKDKSLCTFGEYVTDGAGKAQIEQLQPDPMFVRENLMNKELFKRVVAHLFKMSKLKRFGEINSILGSDPVVKQCVDRVEGGTFWESDSVLLLMAAVRFLQGDYKTKIPSLPQVDEKDVPAMKLAQIDWYCLDFHTCVGRAVKRIFLSKHRDINEKDLEKAWFHGESAKLGGEIETDWVTPYDERLWAQHRGEIQQLTEYAMKRFRLKELEGDETDC